MSLVAGYSSDSESENDIQEHVDGNSLKNDLSSSSRRSLADFLPRPKGNTTDEPPPQDSTIDTHPAPERSSITYSLPVPKKGSITDALPDPKRSSITDALSVPKRSSLTEALHGPRKSISDIIRPSKRSSVGQFLPAPKSTSVGDTIFPPNNSLSDELQSPTVTTSGGVKRVSPADSAPKTKKIILEREVPEETNSSVQTPLASVAGPLKPTSSISSFLPTPKNRQKKEPLTQSKTRRTLGAGVKSTFDGEMTMPVMGDCSVSATSVSNLSGNKSDIIPAAVAARLAKYGQTAIINSGQSSEKGSSKTVKKVPSQEMPALPPLFSFQASPTVAPSASSAEYRPLMISEETTTSNEELDDEAVQNVKGEAHLLSLDTLAETTGVGVSEINKFESRHNRARRSQQPIEVVDFKVDEFYEANEELRSRGDFNNIKRPVQAVGAGRHQLSTLLRSAQQNREGLEETFSRGKRNKREAGKKYGF
jgi:hypothetical protein